MCRFIYIAHKYIYVYRSSKFLHQDTYMLQNVRCETVLILDLTSPVPDTLNAIPIHHFTKISKCLVPRFLPSKSLKSIVLIFPSCFSLFSATYISFCFRIPPSGNTMILLSLTLLVVFQWIYWYHVTISCILACDSVLIGSFFESVPGQLVTPYPG